MPVLGYRGYSGGVPLIYHPETTLPNGLNAKFENVQISPSHNRITGRLRLSSRVMYRYDGVKICLQLHLKLVEQGKNERAEIDMFQHCPIETMLPSCVFKGHRKLDFQLDFPNEQMFPDPFICSYGSLSYKLVALMSKNQKIIWEPIAKKFLMDFKGHYNLSDLEVHPSVECKRFLDGKITSIFTLNKPVLLVGRDTILNATLQLEANLDYEVDVTVTVLRKKQIGEIVETDTISRQRQQVKCYDRSLIFEWSFDVSSISTVTYATEFIAMYSVRYFMKYEASFKPLTKESSTASVFARGDDIVEVKVGTAFDNSTDPNKLAEHLKTLSLESRSTSVASMLTLPPAYSDLSSRVGSVVSLETQPPHYDELDEAESLL